MAGREAERRGVVSSLGAGVCVAGRLMAAPLPWQLKIGVPRSDGDCAPQRPVPAAWPALLVGLEPQQRPRVLEVERTDTGVSLRLLLHPRR